MEITHLTDLHTHYDETVYAANRHQTLLAQKAAGVCGIVNSGSDLPSSQRSVDLAAEYDFVWASVGVFPLSAYTVPEGWLDEIFATVAHEFTHHLEDTAMLHALDDKDAQFLREALAEYGLE